MVPHCGNVMPGCSSTLILFSLYNPRAWGLHSLLLCGATGTVAMGVRTSCHSDFELVPETPQTAGPIVFQTLPPSLSILLYPSFIAKQTVPSCSATSSLPLLPPLAQSKVLDPQPQGSILISKTGGFHLVKPTQPPMIKGSVCSLSLLLPSHP